MKIQVVGGGKMGEALLGGVLGSGLVAPADAAVVELDADRRAALADVFPGSEIRAEVQPNVDAIIAVKPQYVADVAAALAAHGVERVLSVAAGVRTEAIESAMPDAVVIRCMPNTPALVGAGASAIAAGSKAADSDLDWASVMLEAVGSVVRVDEAELDAVTGVSGSGPAYIFRIAEALIAAGVAQGLSNEIADQLARQTIYGAGKLLLESGEDPGVLRENVTSPGGTTAAGLAVLDAADISSIVNDVVAAATARSVELGAS